MVAPVPPRMRQRNCSRRKMKRDPQGSEFGGTCDFVMPGLVPGIHVFSLVQRDKTWMAGTNPAMTR